MQGLLRRMSVPPVEHHSLVDFVPGAVRLTVSYEAIWVSILANPMPLFVDKRRSKTIVPGACRWLVSLDGKMKNGFTK